MNTEATSQKLKQTYWSLQHYIFSFIFFAIIIVSEVTKLAVPCYTLKKVKIKPLLWKFRKTLISQGKTS